MGKEEKDDEKEDKAPEEKDEAAKPEPQPDPRVKEDDDGNVTVDLEPRRTRRERRQEHYDELRRSRDELEAFRGRVAALEAQLYARQPQQQPQQQGASPDEQYERNLDRIRQQQEVIQTALRSGQVTQADEVERLRRQFYDLDGQARKLDRDRLRDEMRDELRRTSAAPSGQYEEMVLRAEYPDVISHPQAMRYAAGLYSTMVAEGQPQNLATSRAAMEKAIARFGLRQTSLPPVSAAQQQKFGAVPGQAGTKGGGEVRLDASQKKMALARWPQLDEHQAYVKMAALLAKARESEQSTE